MLFTGVSSAYDLGNHLLLIVMFLMATETLVKESFISLEHAFLGGWELGGKKYQNMPKNTIFNTASIT